MLLTILLDSLRRFPPNDAYAGTRSGTKEFSRLIFWTPQILWALLAAALLVGLLVGLRRQRGLWWLTALPYLMVLFVIGLEMSVYNIPPFSPAPTQQADGEALFWDHIIPSLWALGLLAGLHVVLVLIQLRQRDN